MALTIVWLSAAITTAKSTSRTHIHTHPHIHKWCVGNNNHKENNNNHATCCTLALETKTTTTTRRSRSWHVDCVGQLTTPASVALNAQRTQLHPDVLSQLQLLYFILSLCYSIPRSLAANVDIYVCVRECVCLYSKLRCFSFFFLPFFFILILWVADKKSAPSALLTGNSSPFRSFSFGLRLHSDVATSKARKGGLWERVRQKGSLC